MSSRIVASVSLVTICTIACCADPASAKSRPRVKIPKEEKAWINGKGMCCFPFAADEVPDSAAEFAAAMEQGYRKALKLSEDAPPPVVIDGAAAYPTVDSLKIDVCGASFNADKKSRKPSDRSLPRHGLDAARFEVDGRRMSVDDCHFDVDLTARDARLLLTRDNDGKPLLVMGDAKEARMSFESSLDDVERILLVGARKGGAGYGLAVDRTELKMKVEDGRSIRIHLKLSTRVAGVIPAGLHFRARMDIDENLNGRLSGMSCTGDDVLGPLISGLIQPFIERYNGKTRPLMNFPKTDMRLRDVQIVSGDKIRLTADFGS